MKSPRLTQQTAGHYDLILENGKLGEPLIEDGEQAAQHALIRVLIFRGEYSLNGELTTKTELGTKYFETVFAMDKSRSEKELEIKSRILGTPGIERILSFEWSQTGRTVTITSTVQTQWGAETVSGEITQL